MRTMLLSLRPDVFEKVISGEKIYEHRKCFPDEPIKAYIYVSSPIKSIRGIMYLSNKTALTDWKKQYNNDPQAVQRIESYINNHHNFGMEINKFEDTNAITLATLKTNLSKFVVPQMYYFIDDSELLNFLNTNLHPNGVIITHEYKDISSSQICQN